MNVHISSPEWALAFGIVLVIVSAWLLRRTRATSSWSQVPGVVLFSDAVSTDGGWKPNVSYRYTVGDTEYKSTRLKLVETSTSSRANALRVANGYRMGQAVTVYVDPKDPTQAVLLNAPQYLASSLFGVAGLILIVLGIYGLLIPSAP